MKIVCAWCQKNIGSTSSHLENELISHGLCNDCRIKLEYNFTSLEDFIENLNKPIMIMDNDAIVLGANESVATMLQKSKEEIKNQVTGQVIECVYADLPEGCGNTIHCTGCTIRNTVTKTYETGQSQIDVEAFQFLNTSTGQKHKKFLISTEKLGNHVLIRFDKISKVNNRD